MIRVFVPSHAGEMFRETPSCGDGVPSALSTRRRAVHLLAAILSLVGGTSRVAELAFRDGIMDRIRLRESRYDEAAYLFILPALDFGQHRLRERRHITGRELSIACRDLALERFGVMSRLVLESWGVKSSSNLGDVVFALVDLGLLMSQPTDSREEFADVFDFDRAFGREYPWCGAHAVS